MSKKKKDVDETIVKDEAIAGDPVEETQDGVEAEGVESDKDEEEVKEEVLDPQEKQIKELEEALKKAEEKAEESEGNALRNLAELENFKKRKEQEVSNFKKYAAEKVVLEFLPILDSLERACEHSGEEKAEKEKEDEKDQNIKEGVQLIQKQLKAALEKLGVKPVEAIDQPFNPNLHQAVMQEEKEGVKADIIIKELQKVYVLHERTIRPAMVVVSK